MSFNAAGTNRPTSSQGYNSGNGGWKPMSDGPRPHNFRTKPCRYFMMGACKNGDRCTFLHERDSSGFGAQGQQQGFGAQGAQGPQQGFGAQGAQGPQQGFGVRAPSNLPMTPSGGFGGMRPGPPMQQW